MTLKILSLFCLITMVGCNHPTAKNDITFIVPNDSIYFYKHVGEVPPPPPKPPREYYLPSNFIIDTGGHVYYYQQIIKSGLNCRDQEWDLPPSFIDLQPKDIIEVPIQNIEDFIKLNIQYIDRSDRHFAIASVADTITSFGLSKIFSVFKDKTNNINWTFRRTTQEENIVLNFKKSKERYYHAGRFKWDLKKTLKDPKMVPPPPQFEY